MLLSGKDIVPCVDSNDRILMRRLEAIYAATGLQIQTLATVEAQSSSGNRMVWLDRRQGVTDNNPSPTSNTVVTLQSEASLLHNSLWTIWTPITANAAHITLADLTPPRIKMMRWLSMALLQPDLLQQPPLINWGHRRHTLPTLDRELAPVWKMLKHQYKLAQHLENELLLIRQLAHFVAGGPAAYCGFATDGVNFVINLQIERASKHGATLLRQYQSNHGVAQAVVVVIDSQENISISMVLSCEAPTPASITAPALFVIKSTKDIRSPQTQHSWEKVGS